MSNKDELELIFRVCNRTPDLAALDVCLQVLENPDPDRKPNIKAVLKYLNERFITE